MRIYENRLHFESTGRTLIASEGIIGLAPNGDVYSGWDEILFEHLPLMPKAPKTDDLNPAELIELADYMIARWQAFRSRIIAQSTSVEPLEGGAVVWRIR